MERVSIITVCYNSKRYLEQTIQSVISQTYPNIEYILVDGASTDGTLEVIQHYASIHPEYIHYVSESDAGIYDAMNKGIRLATGELIGIINSDDWYEYDTVETVVKAYRQHGPAVYHGIQRKHKNGVEIELLRTSANQLNRQMIEHSTCFVPKAIYEEYGLFDEAYRYVGDYELMLRLRQNNVPFVPLDYVLANFREGGVSQSSKAIWENYQLWRRLGLMTLSEYWYRSAMDRVKIAIRGS